MRLSVYAKLGVALGIILVIVSMVFSVLLCIEFGSSGLSKAVLAMCGFAVQGTQTVLFIFGVYSWKVGKKGKGVFFIAVWAAFFGLSIVASVSHFSTTNAVKQEQTASHDPAYLRMQERYNQLGKMIEQSGRRIDDFAKRTIMTKGVIPETAKQKELIRERNELADRMDSFQGIPAEDKMFYMLAEFLGCENVRTLKLICFFVLGFLIDLGAVCLLFNDLDVSGSFYERFDSDFDPEPNPEFRKPKPRDRQDNPMYNPAYNRSGNPETSALQARLNNRPAQYREEGYNPVQYRDGYNPDKPVHKLKDIPPESRPGFNPDMYAKPDDGNADELRVLAMLRANPGLMDMLNPGSNPDRQSDPVQYSTEGYNPGSNPDRPVQYKEGYNPVSNPDRQQDITPDRTADYIDLLYPVPSKHDGSLNGRRSIADRIEISNKHADRIHNYLKKNNYIQVHGTKTFAVYGKEELLDMLGLGLESPDNNKVIRMKGGAA